MQYGYQANQCALEILCLEISSWSHCMKWIPLKETDKTKLEAANKVTESQS